MAITEILEESEMIDAGAPSIKYEGERPLKKQEMLMAGPDWYLKRMQLLMDEYGYDYDEAGEIAYDSDKYYEVIGIDPGGIGDESRIMDEEVVEEEGIMKAAKGGVAIQGGVKNYKPSKMVYVPKTAKSSPTHPTAHLAYITDAEKKLLIKKNLHGSLKGKPNRGPGGIPSLQGDFGSPTGQTGGKGSTYSSPADSDKRESNPWGDNVWSGGDVQNVSNPWGDNVWDGGDVQDGPTKKTPPKDDKDPKQDKKDKEQEQIKTAINQEQKKKDALKKKLDLIALADAEDEQKALSYVTGPTKIEKDQWDLDRFDKNKDGKLGPIEKHAKFQSGLGDKYLQRTVVTEMDKLGGANKSGIDFTKSREQGGVHRGSGVPVNVWQTMTPEEKQYASVVQDYDIDKILGAQYKTGLPKSKETGHQKYTHGDLTYYSPTKGKIVERTGAYPIVAKPMIEHPLLMSMQPYPVQESALASLHRLGTAKAGMSNQALGIKGMGRDELEEFKISNKNFPPGSGPKNEPSEDPCKGPNPPAYCYTGGKPNNDDEEEDDWMLGLAFRKDGGRVGRAYGGIMDKYTGRRAYGLGSIFKKAKKIFKSPLGKAALLGLGGWKAGLFSGLGGGGGFLSSLKNMSLGKKAALTLGGGALAGMLAGQESEDKDGDGYDDKTGFPIQKYKDNPYDRHGDWRMGLAVAKDGGRIGYASGGDIADMSNDPEYRGWKLMYERNKDVASMHPKHSDFVKYYQNVDRDSKAEGGLMDLGGMEKDYRADGGFVPIGKKERADDVPARLSKNEFVFTADAVRNAGGGDVDKGAEVMYNMMKNLEAGGEVSEESQGLDGAREMFQVSQRLEEVL